MGVESSKVEIKIGVVDDGASATVGAVTAKVEGLGAAGSMTGQKMAQATAGMAGNLNGAAAAAAAFADRTKAAIAAYEAQAARGVKVQEYLGAQFDKFSANNPAVAAFEKAAAAAAQFTPAVEKTAKAGEKAANAARGMGAAYGEARVAMGAMMGSGRMMEMGLANIGSRLNWMAPLWKAALPVMLGVGMVGLIAQMGEGVYDLYEKWFDVDGAIEKYNEKASEAAEKKFYANSGLDQLNADLQVATKRLDDLNRKKGDRTNLADLIASPFYALGGEGRTGPLGTLSDAREKYFSMGDAQRLNHNQTKVDQGTLQLMEERHKAALQAINDEKLLAEARAHTGRARARVDEQAAEKAADENRSYRQNYDKQLAAITNRGKKPGDEGYATVVPNAGQSEYDQTVHTAKVKQQAADIEAARHTADEMRRLQEQAIEANLKGIALLEQKRKFEDKEWVRQHRASADAVMAIDARWYAQEKNYWQQQMDAFNRMAAEAMNASEKQRAAQDKFGERVNELGAESQVRGATGVARIRAEMQLELDRFDAEAKTANARPADVARGEQAIRGGAAQQIADEQERVRQQTEEIESQARARRLSSEQSQTQAIESEYEQRLNKFNEELHRQEIGWDDYNRRVIAAGEMRDAQLADAARQSRERMAGEFSGFFRSLDHPLLALASIGDKVGGQAAAALMQRFQNHYSGSQGAGPMHGDFSPHTILDRIAGTTRQQTPAAPELASSSAAAHMIAVASAHIQVGSASIGFGGAAGAPGSTPGGPAMGTVGSPGAFPVSGGGTGSPVRSGNGTRLYDVNQNAVAIPGMAGAVPVSSGGTGSAAWTGAPGSGLYDVNQNAVAMGTNGAPGFAASGNTAGMAGAAISDVGAGMALFQQGRSIFGSGAGAPGAASSTASAAGNAGAHGTNFFKEIGSFFTHKHAAPGSASGLIDTTSPNIKGKFDKNGVWQEQEPGTGMLNGGGVTQDNMGGAAGGALGMWSAEQGNGGVGGALNGAMSGMQLGMALGGPLGAAIGAGAGAIVGAIGFGGREKARVYDLRTVRPQIAQDYLSFQTGGDYLGIYGDLQTLDVTAERTTKQWGPVAHGYYNDVIREEIGQARGRLDQMAKAGRADFGMSAAQYDVGVDSLHRSGLAVIHQRERIIPGDQNERITRALETGAASRRLPVQAAGAWSGDIHIHTIDAKGVKQFLDQNKHLLRSALNQSYAENSGGADAGF